MKTQINTIKLLLLSVLFLGLQACSSDDDNPAPVNEEEVITTMTIRFTPVGGGTELVLRTQDLDGDGPNQPVLTEGITFATNTVYNAEIELLNELENPAEDITEEVEEEADEHQFFYLVTGGNVTTAYADMDGNGNPIGLAFTLTTGAAASNNDITITLRHEPVKDAAGVSDGDITNANGETDIEATFDFFVN